MKFLEGFDLKKWYVIILWLGILSCIGAVFSTIEFLENKHLFGFGLGLILIGLSFLMSEKNIHEFAQGGVLSYQIRKQNFVSIIVLILGLVVTGFFLFLIFKELI